MAADDVRELYERRVGDWRSAGEDATSESTRRVAFAEEVIARHAPPGARCLDIGGAVGLLCERLHRRGYDVYGADVAPGMVEATAERMRPLGVPGDHFRVSGSCSLPFEDGSFDVVSAFNVFMYLDNQLIYIREIRRVLRPGAIACVDSYIRGGLRPLLWQLGLPLQCLPVRPTYWRLSRSLYRTGMYSLAKFPHLASAVQARSADQLDGFFAREGFTLVAGYPRYLLPALDRRPLEWAGMAARMARRWGHLYTGVYRKEPAETGADG